MDLVLEPVMVRLVVCARSYVLRRARVVERLVFASRSETCVAAGHGVFPLISSCALHCLPLLSSSHICVSVSVRVCVNRTQITIQRAATSSDRRWSGLAKRAR